MFVVAKVSLREGWKMRHLVGVTDRSSFFAPSKFYIPLVTPSKTPSREGPATFSISRTLHLDPGNPREEWL